MHILEHVEFFDDFLYGEASREALESFMTEDRTNRHKEMSCAKEIKMDKTAKNLIEYATGQHGKPYWYATYGQIANKDLWDRKKKQYPNSPKSSVWKSM